jgi:uncharacterized protein
MRSRKTALSAERLVYADSSALVKLVIKEPESEALASHLESAPHVLATSPIALVQVQRTIGMRTRSRRARRPGSSTRACFSTSATPCFARPSALRHGRCGGFDALYLASAQRIGADEVLAYDRRLAGAAANQGFAVMQLS